MGGPKIFVFGVEKQHFGPFQGAFCLCPDAETDPDAYFDLNRQTNFPYSVY
jgi:hypothetical protein